MIDYNLPDTSVKNTPFIICTNSTQQTESVMKRLKFKYDKSLAFSSKQNLCLVPKVSQQECPSESEIIFKHYKSHSDKNFAIYHPSSSEIAHVVKTKIVNKSEITLWDFGSLRSLGLSLKICPYLLAKHLIPFAKVIVADFSQIKAILKLLKIINPKIVYYNKLALLNSRHSRHFVSCFTVKAALRSLLRIEKSFQNKPIFISKNKAFTGYFLKNKTSFLFLKSVINFIISNCGKTPKTENLAVKWLKSPQKFVSDFKAETAFGSIHLKHLKLCLKRINSLFCQIESFPLNSYPPLFAVMKTVKDIFLKSLCKTQTKADSPAKTIFFSDIFSSQKEDISPSNNLLKIPVLDANASLEVLAKVVEASAKNVPDGVVVVIDDFGSFCRFASSPELHKSAGLKPLFFETCDFAETNYVLESFERACDKGVGGVLILSGRREVVSQIEFRGHYGNLVVWWGGGKEEGLVTSLLGCAKVVAVPDFSEDGNAFRAGKVSWAVDVFKTELKRYFD